jgi:glycosyltransferase involved in cell wall biosynthesis
MKKVSIIIPVYNNHGSLKDLLAQLEATSQIVLDQGIAFELIFVDDGSSDGSFEELVILTTLLEIESKVVKLTKNFGAINASNAGLRFVTGDAFVFLAADLQDPPSLIPSMIEAWLAGNKFVVCERDSRDDSWRNKFASKIFYSLLRKFVLESYPSGGFDLALMDASLLPPVRDSAKSAYIPILLWWLGYEPTVIKYARNRRLHGKSGWTLTKKINVVLDVFLGFSYKPIRFLTFIGILVSSLSFMYGMIVIVLALANQIPVQGYATIVVLITFLLGLILCSLGVIGEYLWRVLDEVNKRPRVIIEKIISSVK